MMQGPQLSGIARRAGKKAWLRMAAMLVAAACMIPLAAGVPAIKANAADDLTASQVPAGTEVTDGLVLGKSAAAGSDGRSADVTLSSYSTGGVTTKVNAVPTDAMILLSYGKEMKYGIDGTESTDANYSDAGSRWTAAVAAVSAYIDMLHDDAVNRGVTHRISIVLYTGASTSADSDAGVISDVMNANSLASSDANIANIKATLAACGNFKWYQNVAATGCPLLGGQAVNTNGMATAERQLAAQLDTSYYSTVGGIDINNTDSGPSSNKRNKNVITITDADFGLEDSNNQTNAYRLSVFAAMNWGVLAKFNSYQWTKPGYDAAHPDTPIKREGRTWGMNFYSLSVNGKTSPTGDFSAQRTTGSIVDSTTLANRFLQAKSSNFPNAGSIGGEGENINNANVTGGLHDGNSSAGFFKSFADADSLYQELMDIGTKGYITTTLGNDVRTSDYSSDYFDAPTDASSVKVYSQKATNVDADGNVTWSDTLDPLTVTTDANATLSDGQVLVQNVAADSSSGRNAGIAISGYDYDTNYVGARTDSDTTGDFGSRLVVRFTETAKNCFLGGANVPTNQSDYSGLEEADGTLLGKFYDPDAENPGTEPTANVALEDNCLTTGTDALAYTQAKIDQSKLTGLIQNSDGSPRSFTKSGDYIDDAYASVTYAVSYAGTQVGTLSFAAGAESGTWTWNGKYATSGNQAFLTQDDAVLTITPTLSATGMADVTADSHTVTVYMLSALISVKDSQVVAGDSAQLSDNITGWQWINKKAWTAWKNGDSGATKAEAVRSVYYDGSTPKYTLLTGELTGTKSLKSNDSDAPAYPQDLAATFVAGDNSAGTTATSSTKFKPEMNTDWKMSLAVTGNGATNALKTIEASKLTDVANSLTNGSTADYDFRIWVTVPAVESLPLTGGEGANFLWPLLGVGSAALAALVWFLKRREAGQM